MYISLLSYYCLSLRFKIPFNYMNMLINIEISVLDIKAKQYRKTTFTYGLHLHEITCCKIQLLYSRLACKPTLRRRSLCCDLDGEKRSIIRRLTAEGLVVGEMSRVLAGWQNGCLSLVATNEDSRPGGRNR